MVQIKVDLRGIDDVVEKLTKKADLTPVQNVVRKHGAKLASKTRANMRAAYTGHMAWSKEAHALVHVDPTGHTWRSVTNTLSNKGLTATVSVGTKYFPYLEYGTRFMAPRPTLHPAFTYQSIRFVADLKKALKDD